MGLLDILNQVITGSGGTGQQFDQVAQQAPTDALAAGITQAFRSDQTPDIGSMVGQLFGQSNAGQQAGLLNQVIAAIGPAAAAGLAGGVLGKVMQGGGRVAEDGAAQLSPQQVNEVVTEGSAVNPNLADQLGQFYAEHQGLIKVLGGVALAIAATKMKDHLAQR